MVVLPKGTLVRVGGMPFRLLEDTEVDGLQSNYDLAMSSTSLLLAGQVGLEGYVSGPLSRGPTQELSAQALATAPRKYPEGTPLSPTQAQEFAGKLGLSLNLDGSLSNTRQP